MDTIKMISRLKAKEMITELKNGSIYSVTFIKKDGTKRLLNSIKGTRKGVVGKGLKFDSEEKGLIPVYDIQLARKGEEENRCWRMVNVNTLTEVCVNHENFQVID